MVSGVISDDDGLVLDNCRVVLSERRRLAGGDTNPLLSVTVEK